MSRSLRRALPLMGVLVSVAPATAHAQASASLANWNLSEQRAVVADGVMANGPDGTFDGQLALGAADMQSILAALAVRPGTARLTAWNDRSVAGFDAAMVDELGLGSVASHVQAVAGGAGLHPPRYFGTEVLARQLGLRVNHPAAQDAIELYPSDQITRAEAAHTLAKLVAQGTWAAPAMRSLFAGFALPAYTSAQLAPLTVAVSKIGMPYIWGGVSDSASATQAHGGYDCSGLIWRAYKVPGNAAGGLIAGRTAAQMAGEVPRSARLPLSGVAPGDLLFFGSAGPSGAATEASITHSAIALSSRWAIESSNQGVNVAPITTGWLYTSFAWGRRVLSTAPVAAPTPAASPPPAPAHGSRSPTSAHRIAGARRPSSPVRVRVRVQSAGGLSAPGTAPSSSTVGSTGGAGFPG